MYNNGDLTPVCVRIIDAQEDGKGITLYDAELIDEINDGNLNLTTQSTSLLNSDMEVDIDHLSTYVNVAQQCDQTKHNFDYEETLQNTSRHPISILNMRTNMDDTNQMDSGANHNVTNDKKYSSKFHKDTTDRYFWYWKEGRCVPYYRPRNNDVRDHGRYGPQHCHVLLTRLLWYHPITDSYCPTEQNVPRLDTT